MVSSCLSRWSFTSQTLAGNARNRAKTTKLKSDVLEPPVILITPDPVFCAVCPGLDLHVSHLLWIEHEEIRMTGFARDGFGCNLFVNHSLNQRQETTPNRSRFWGRGCDEALFSEKKGFLSEKEGGIQRMRGLVRTSTGKHFGEEVGAIQ